MLRILQSSEMLAARRRFYETVETKATLDLADLELVEELAHAWHSVGLLVRRDPQAMPLVLERARSVDRIWRVAEPFVRERRDTLMDPSLYRAFEELAARCRREDRLFDRFVTERLGIGAPPPLGAGG